MKVKIAVIGLLAALPLLASAQEARSSKWVNMRAGPARDFPLVATLPPDTPLAVQGCTEGYGWCDVIGPDGLRGWIYAGNIVYPYQSSVVPVLSYGALIGLPIVTFAIGNYWDNFYRGRPWYPSLPRWRNFRPPPPQIRPPHWQPPPPLLREPHAPPRSPFVQRPEGSRPPPPPMLRQPHDPRPGGPFVPGGPRPETRPGGERPGGGPFGPGR